MRVMVMVKASPGSEAGVMPSEQLIKEMGQYNEELVKAGIMKAGDGLKPSSEGVRVHFSGKKRTVTDGPFVETKELVAGYWLWEVESMEQAVEWVKKCPNPMMDEESDIDIRPLYENEDFAEWDSSGDMVSQEESLRGAIAAQNATVQPYLFFNGCCEEALRFYETTLGARVGTVMRYEQSPDPVPESVTEPGFEKKILHCDFTVGDMTVMASDSNSAKGIEGFSLSLAVQSNDDAKRLFSALSDGGTINMPLGETFFSPCFGQVTDRFGVQWMVIVPGDTGSG